DDLYGTDFWRDFRPDFGLGLDARRQAPQAKNASRCLIRSMYTCNHITVLCSDVERSFDFYVNKLGLTLLARWPRMFAVRAGEVRFSVSQSEEIANEGNIQIILRTDNIESAKEAATKNGIELIQ